MAKLAPPDACTHHWLIDPPNGPLVGGRCKRCGLSKTFAASGEYTPDGYKPRGRRRRKDFSVKLYPDRSRMALS